MMAARPQEGLNATLFPMTSIEIWDGAAEGWERHADFVDEQTAAATRRMLALAQIGTGDSVLDLTCGPGGAGIAAAELVGNDGSVVLSDGSARMLAIAARRASSRSNVSTAIVDLAAIDLPSRSFDAAICRHGLMFVEDPAAAIRSVFEILRPGGRLVVATWDRREANPWIGLILDAVSEQFGAPFPPPGVPGPFSIDDPAQLADLFADAAFEDVHVEAIPTPMRSPSLDAWWERVPQLAGPLALALSAMEPKIRDAIRDRALTAGAELARDTADGVELDGSILVGSGRRPG